MGSDVPWETILPSVSCCQVLNPSETFGDIIVDYSYVECTSACISALCAFRERYPEHRSTEIADSLRRGKNDMFVSGITTLLSVKQVRFQHMNVFCNVTYRT
jgi:hypothetical protein